MLAAAEIPTHVRHADSAADREAVYRLRYDVYIAEMGKPLRAADHDRGWLADDLDRHSTVILVSKGSEVVGTVRIAPCDERLPIAMRACFAIERLGRYAAVPPTLCSRMVIAPAWRGSDVVRLLSASVYRAALASGTVFLVCQCRPALVDFYQRLGFRHYVSSFVEDDAGHQIPLVLAVHDHDSLHAARSPFLALADATRGDPNVGPWLVREFGPPCEPVETIGVEAVAARL